VGEPFQGLNGDVALYPGLSRSALNPGLQLANAFGVLCNFKLTRRTPVLEDRAKKSAYFTGDFAEDVCAYSARAGSLLFDDAHARSDAIVKV
jgi:hypothetical protein